MSDMTTTVQGGAELAAEVARAKADDPGCVVCVVDVGDGLFDMTVTPSEDKDAPVEAPPNVRGTGTTAAVSKAWEAWR